MVLHNSGKDFREYETGAVRDTNDKKGRADLLPLQIIGIIQQDNIYKKIGQYIYDGEYSSLIDALWLFAEQRYDGCWETTWLEVSKQYQDGADKYADRNWEKGIPLHCYIDSAVRHYIKYRRGDKDEPHDRAFVWNILGALFTHIKLPKMIDLPFSKNKLDISGLPCL